MKNLFGLIYVSPLDARQRMIIFKLTGETEKKEWFDHLLRVVAESNCIADPVGLLF